MIAVVVAALVFAGAVIALIPVLVGWQRESERERADAKVDAAIQAAGRKAAEAKVAQLTADLELADAHEKVLQEIAGEASARPVPPGAGLGSLRQGLREAARARAAATTGAADRAAAAGAVPARAAAAGAAPGPAPGGGVPGGRA